MTSRRSVFPPIQIMKAAALFLVLMFSTLLTSAQDPTTKSTKQDLRQLLQEGLFEEEANRNLDKASAAYESLLKSFDMDRQFAATAVFRLGEVRAKQGRKEDAVALFQRVLREF